MESNLVTFASLAIGQRFSQKKAQAFEWVKIEARKARHDNGQVCKFSGNGKVLTK